MEQNESPEFVNMTFVSSPFSVKKMEEKQPRLVEHSYHCKGNNLQNDVILPNTH